MILVDAGPLIALIDRGDADHRVCVSVAAGLTEPLATTWPVLTEAMYAVGRNGGWPGQEALWRLVLKGNLSLHAIDARLEIRLCELMRRYRDLPMDLADATLVVAAESLGEVRVFTLDQHFRVYRLTGGKHFELIDLPRRRRR